MSDWLPVDEAKKKFGLSRATIYRLIAEGRVQRAKRAGDVRAYVNATDLRDATTLKVTDPVAPRAPARKAARRRG